MKMYIDNEDHDITYNAALSVEKALSVAKELLCPDCNSPDVYCYEEYQKTSKIYEIGDNDFKFEDMFGYEFMHSTWRCDDCGWED